MLSNYNVIIIINYLHHYFEIKIKVFEILSFVYFKELPTFLSFPNFIVILKAPRLSIFFNILGKITSTVN